MKINKKKIKQPKFEIDEDAFFNGDKVSLERKRNIRKIKAKRRSIIIKAIISVVLIAVLICTAIVILDKKGVLTIEQIEVKGNSYYDDASIIKYSKLKTGTRLLAVDKKDIIKKVEQLKYVESANISRKLPHKLVINVKERPPEYAVYAGGYYIYLDRNLYILNKSNKASNLKIIEGFTPESVKEGTKFKTEDIENFKLAIDLADIIEENNISICKISHRNSFMRIFFSKNMVCEGTYKNLVKYVTKLNDILDELNKNGIERATIYIGDNDYVSFSPRIE